MTNDFFSTRYKLKVYIKGSPIKIHKSDSFDYIKKVIDDYKAEYEPSEVEFRYNKSEVLKVSKPRHRTFKNMPEWDRVSYGVNSDGGYYLRNEETKQIIRIYEDIGL